MKKLSFFHTPYKKRSAQDAHCGVQGRCRKRPPQAQECAEAHSLLTLYWENVIQEISFTRKRYNL